MIRMEVSSGDRSENLWVYVAKLLQLRDLGLTLVSVHSTFVCRNHNQNYIDEGVEGI